MKVLWWLMLLFIFGNLADGDTKQQKLNMCRYWTGIGFRPSICGAAKVNSLFISHVYQNEAFVTGWDKILLSVYYGSQCPDSKSFVLDQLRPALQLLHPHIELQLVPFGKSMSINYGDGGFECQHGPAECLGNMVQDCALYQMRRHSNLDQLAYVACELESEAGSRGNLECVSKAGLRTELVEKCMSTKQGTKLQLDSEYLTLLMKPKFIPTIAIDALFNQHVQDNALVDLPGTLCAEPALESTAACAHYYNSLALRHLHSYPLDDEPEDIPLYKYQTYFYID